LALSALLALGGACKGATVDVPDAAPSPQAKAEPAPLANLTATSSATATTTLGADGGPPPELLRADQPLAADTPRESSHDAIGKGDPARDPKDLAGYALVAVLRTGEGPPAPKGPEVNAAAIEAARRKAEAHVAIEASQTRARFVLSGGFVLPQATELRARVDRYGHVLLWPGEDSYRVLAPGSLRALLGERRVDVAPLAPADVSSAGDGARRLGLRTRRIEVTTRVASATIELGSVREAGDGGVLVCRWLLDLMGAAPNANACASDEVPLHAELRWTTRGQLAFDVTSMVRRVDLLAQDLAAPPAMAPFATAPLPIVPADTITARTDLAALRTSPVDVPPAGGAPGAKTDAAPPPQEAGLALVNSTDELRVAWIDAVPAAWVAPGARISLPTLVRGRYTLQWRTFLGDGWDPPETLVVPGTSEVGAIDAGP
jgi:hypothetical protein